MSSTTQSPNYREILSARSTISGKQEYLTSTNGILNVSGGGSGGGGTQYVEGTTTTPATGTVALGRYLVSSPGTLTDGQLSAPLLDSFGQLKVVPVGTVMTNITQIGGSNIALGQTTKSASIPVVIPSDQTVPVSGTFWQTTQPISAASLPLPTGAATSAKQPALGTAGTASSDVITIQGITSMTPLKVDGSGVTQPISGIVTANAGTNLNTSALALETGGNLATIVTNTGTLAGAVTSSVVQENIKQINGVAPLMGNGTTGTGSQRVTIASDNTAFAVNATLQTGSNAIGSITNTSFASTQATASSLNATVVGTGTFAVQAAQSGTWTVGSNSATGSAVPANAFYDGLLAKTSNPTAASDGNLTGALADKLGKQVVVGSIRDLKGNQFTTITSSTSETTVVTAVASTFLDVYGVIVENTSATASKVTFKDSTGGTTQFEIYVPAGDTRGFMLPESAAFKQTTVNTNWTATCGTSVASIVISMLYVKNI